MQLTPINTYTNLQDHSAILSKYIFYTRNIVTGRPDTLLLITSTPEGKKYEILDLESSDLLKNFLVTIEWYYLMKTNKNQKPNAMYTRKLCSNTTNSTTQLSALDQNFLHLCTRLSSSCTVMFHQPIWHQYSYQATMMTSITTLYFHIVYLMLMFPTSLMMT